jgi:hypothetical protein
MLDIVNPGSFYTDWTNRKVGFSRDWSVRTLKQISEGFCNTAQCGLLARGICSGFRTDFSAVIDIPDGIQNISNLVEEAKCKPGENVDWAKPKI